MNPPSLTGSYFLSGELLEVEELAGAGDSDFALDSPPESLLVELDESLLEDDPFVPDFFA